MTQHTSGYMEVVKDRENNTVVERTIEIVLTNETESRLKDWPTKISIRADGKEIAFSKRWMTSEQVLEGLFEHLGVDVEALKERVRKQMEDKQ